MQVVIIAAGSGSRLGALTDGLPKFFLNVAGRSVRDYQAEALAPLVKAGTVCPEVTVVLGHGFDADASHDPDALLPTDGPIEWSPIVIEDWDRRENAWSALAGVQSLEANDHLLLICGDIITTSEQLETFLSIFATRCAPNRYSAVSAFEGHQNEMTAVNWNDELMITDYGDISGHQEAGMFVLHEAHRDAAVERWRKASTDAWFPTVFTDLPTRAIRLDPTEHIEINTPAHLADAQEALPFE
jgi:choline kinase